jgi:hypothetical protein
LANFIMRSKVSCGQQQDNTERSRQSDAPSNNEKSSGDKNRKTSKGEEVGHTQNDRKFAKGGRRRTWEPPVTPETLAEWLKSDQAREIPPDPEMPC